MASSLGTEPPPQGSHAVAPAVVATVPFSHKLHVEAPSGEKVPTSQSSHRVASLLGTEPWLHTSHVDALVGFATVPLSHELHVGAPSGEKVPGSHGVHAWAPIWLVNVPGALVYGGGVEFTFEIELYGWVAVRRMLAGPTFSFKHQRKITEL